MVWRQKKEQAGANKCEQASVSERGRAKAKIRATKQKNRSEIECERGFEQERTAAKTGARKSIANAKTSLGKNDSEQERKRKQA
eukprot:4594835-Pleurochrysis_carterae.AAC.1